MGKGSLGALSPAHTAYTPYCHPWATATQESCAFLMLDMHSMLKPVYLPLVPSGQSSSVIVRYCILDKIQDKKMSILLWDTFFQQENSPNLQHCQFSQHHRIWGTCELRLPLPLLVAELWALQSCSGTAVLWAHKDFSGTVAHVLSITPMWSSLMSAC